MHIDEGKKFDKRTIERNLREGSISAKEWEKYLKALPDVSDSAAPVLLDEEQEGKTTGKQETKSGESAEKEEATQKKE